MWVSGKTLVPVNVALLALNLIGLSLGSPLPQRLNQSSSSLVPLIPLSSSSHPLSHSSWKDSNSDSASSSSFSSASSPTQSGHSQSPPSTTANPEQVDRVQLLSSPWESAQFNLPFSVSNSHLSRPFFFIIIFFSLLLLFFSLETCLCVSFLFCFSLIRFFFY